MTTGFVISIIDDKTVNFSALILHIMGWEVLIVSRCSVQSGYTLKMEAIFYFETRVVTYQTMRCLSSNVIVWIFTTIKTH